MEEKKSDNLAELIQQKVKKRRGPSIQQVFFSKMTPEELTEWYKVNAAKRKETMARKRAEKLALQEKAKSMLPEVLALEIANSEIQKDSFIPKQETIDKLKLMISKSMSTEELRSKHFPRISDQTWHRLMKFVFKSQVSGPEDLGAELMRAKSNQLTRLKKALRGIKKQMKFYTIETGKKTLPAYLLQMERDYLKEIMELEMDVPKVLAQIEAVGEKSKSPSLHLHMKTPRPPKEDEKVVEEV